MDHTDKINEASLSALKENNSDQKLSEVNPKNLSNMFSQGHPNPNPKRQPPPATTTTNSRVTTTNSHLFAGSKLTDELELKKLQVFVRVRPSSTMAAPFFSSSQQQSQQGEEVCVHAASTHALAIAPPEGSQAYKAGDRGQTYAFSRVFDAETTQQEYYESTAKPLVTDLLCNRQHNSVMMAYGITAAGKTYTIEGTKSQPGVMPRALTDLFDGLEDNNNNSTQEDIRVKVSFCEVYNEQIYDLLLSEGGGAGGGGEHQRPALKLKEDAAGRVIVGGLKEIVVHNVDEALLVLRRGSKQRQRAGTGLNYASSRSHSIFTVILYDPVYEKKGKKVDVEIEVGGNNIGEEKVDGGDDETDKNNNNNNNNNNHQVVIEEQRLGRIAFVDLAGSERAQRTGNVGVRLKESVAINSSLMTLGRCLEALRWNQKCHKEGSGNGNGGNALHLKVVPYRESKVTHLFRDALHGWGRVILSVNVSPVAADYDETSHVLKYAALATQIGTLQTGEAPRRRGTKVNKTPMVLKRKGGGNDDGGDGNNKKKMKVERQGSVPLTGQSQTVTDVVSNQQQQQQKQIEEVDEVGEEDSYVQHDVSRQVSVEVEEEEKKEEVSQQGQGRVEDREEESVSFTLNRRSLSAVSEPGGEFCPITSITPPFIVNNNNNNNNDDGDIGGGAPLYYCDDDRIHAAIHQATTTTPQSHQSNAVTPIATAGNGGDGDGNLEFLDEEEDVAGLQARVQQLIAQLQAAEEKCVLIESEVRAEVAEEMSALLRDMEANYKERLMMSNNGSGGSGGNSRGGGVPMSQMKDKKKAAAAAVVEEEEEMEECDGDDDDAASGSEGSPSSLISSPPSSATTTDNEEEEDSDDDSNSDDEEEEMDRELKIDLSKAKERISELESQLEQLMECNTALQKELEEANNDGSRLYNEYQALLKQLEEAKENVTQVEANTTMEQELIENQLDREKKNNAMLQERLNAAMGALAAIGSPSTTIMQKLAAAHGNNNNGGGVFRNGSGNCIGGNNSNMNGGGMEPGHTPHDIALMRARRAAAAEEEQHQLLQQQLLNSAGPPPSTGSAGGGHNSMPPLSLPPPGTAYSNRPSRFASQQPQREAAGDGDDVPLSLPPPKNNDDIEDEKEETEEEEEGKLGGGDDAEEEEKEKLTSEQKLKRRSSNRRRTTTTTTTTTISSIIEALDAAATTSSPPDDHVGDDEEEEDAEEEEAEIKEVTEKEAVPVSEASPLLSPPMHYDDMECSPCPHIIEDGEEAGIALSSDAERMEAEDKEDEGEEDEDMSPIIGQPEEEDIISPASDEEEEEEEEESEDSLDEDDSEEESESEEEEWAPSDEEDEEEEEEEEKEIDDLVPTGVMKKNPKSRVKKKENSGGGGGVEMKQAGHKKRSENKGGKRGDRLEEAFNNAAVGEKEKEEKEEEEEREEDNAAAAVVVQIEHTEKKKTTKRRLLNNPNSARMRNVLGDWNSMEEGEDSVGGVRAVSVEASAQVAIANLRRSGRARR